MKDTMLFSLLKNIELLKNNTKTKQQQQKHPTFHISWYFHILSYDIFIIILGWGWTGSMFHISKTDKGEVSDFLKIVQLL